MLLVYPVVQNRRLALSAEQENLPGFEKLKVPRSEVPAVTHVDFSARVQTIDSKRNPFMHGVISLFNQMTNCPVVINPSFNVRGEPIVCTAEDAYRCFMATEIDALVVGNRMFYREEQGNRPLDDQERAKWLRRFEHDR